MKHMCIPFIILLCLFVESIKEILILFSWFFFFFLKENSVYDVFFLGWFLGQGGLSFELVNSYLIFEGVNSGFFQEQIFVNK